MKPILSYGDRKKNLETDPKTYGTIYRMHKYWAKKPHNIINEYIKKYSKKNDIVLDPFCGSGIALIEAYNSKRRSIGIDINPIASSISKGILTSINIKKFEKEFLKIEADCKKKINSFYLLKRNNITYVGTHFLWMNGKLDEVRTQNGTCISRKPTAADVRLAKSFSYSKIRKYYPKDKLFDNGRINSNSKYRIYDLFTPRNTTALAILLDKINKINDKKIRELFRLCFSSMLGQTSKMVFVNNNSLTENGKKKLTARRVGSWVIGYWVRF